MSYSEKPRKFKEKITRIEPALPDVLVYVRYIMNLPSHVLSMVVGTLKEYGEYAANKDVSLLIFAKEKAEEYAQAALEFGAAGTRKGLSQQYHIAHLAMEKVAYWVDKRTEVSVTLVEVGARKSDYDDLDDEEEVVSAADVKRGRLKG